MDNESNKIIILTVADPNIGLGHLFRCDAIAQALLINEGRKPQLLVACNAGYDWLKKRSPVTSYKIACWNEDVEEIKKNIRDFQTVIVDAYQINDDVWSELCNSVSQLVVFDDTGEKPTFKGTLVNGSPGAHFVKYKDFPGQQLLLGTDYQVLRPPFWKSIDRKSKRAIEKVLIMGGGTDYGNIIDILSRVTMEVMPDGVEIVVIGDIRAYSDSRIKSIGFLEAAQLKEHFDSADLLISAAGQTVAEAVSCKLPTIMVQTAKNQEFNVRGWIEYGVAIFADDIGSPRLKRELKRAIVASLSFQKRRDMVSAANVLNLSDSTTKLSSILSEV